MQEKRVVSATHPECNRCLVQVVGLSHAVPFSAPADAVRRPACEFWEQNMDGNHENRIYLMLLSRLQIPLSFRHHPQLGRVSRLPAQVSVRSHGPNSGWTSDSRTASTPTCHSSRRRHRLSSLVISRLWEAQKVPTFATHVFASRREQVHRSNQWTN